MGNSLQPLKVWLVDDDPFDVKLMLRAARAAKLDWSVDTFSDGEKVCQAAKERPELPHLILLDLNLPDMTGIDILARVKANPHLKRSPVIVLTTTDDQREIQRCYDLGANVYIVKPVNYESFANAIRQLGLFLSVIQVP